jgi:hypothetical protein
MKGETARRRKRYHTHTDIRAWTHGLTYKWDRRRDGESLTHAHTSLQCTRTHLIASNRRIGGGWEGHLYR